MSAFGLSPSGRCEAHSAMSCTAAYFPMGSINELKMDSSNTCGSGPGTPALGCLRGFIEAIAAGQPCADVIVVRGDRRTLQAVLPDGRAVVIKLWDLRGARGSVRRMLHWTKGRAEWTVGRHLYRLGIPVPNPIAYLTLDSHRCTFHECVVWEHLGDVRPAAVVLHEAAKAADVACLQRVSASVEALTERCLGAGLFDNDHRIGNFLVKCDGSAFRMDFENAALRHGGLSYRALGVMLGGLIASYATMVCPRPGTADRFAADLLLRCRVAARARSVVLLRAQAEIDGWSSRTGIAVGFDRAWILSHCQDS